MKTWKIRPGACLALALASLGAGPTHVLGQDTRQDGPNGEPAVDGPAKVMAASPVERGTIRLDGRLDEGVWTTASFRSDLRQKGRDVSFDPRVETEVAFLYDDEALYVGARMARDTAQPPNQVLGRRDDVGNSERILVSLDTHLDHRTSYTFGVTISGVRVDLVQARDNESWADESFDPVWDARVSSDEDGWTAEMRIPFSELRFPDGDEQIWGINVRRWNPATFLNLYWVVVPYYETGWASRFGQLRGISGVSGGSPFRVTPYVLGRATYFDGGFVGDPTETRSRIGADAKVGLGSDLTLDVTVNPDFGQVEADPARVNLTAFETFFPERRPFFLEGIELFRSRGPNWFYSRRIGSVPTGAISQDRFEEVENATVLGGAKVTGRLTDDVSVSAVGAVTGEERLPAPPGSTQEGLLAAPTTTFGAVRLQRELGANGSTVGFTATGVDRSLDGGRLEARLPGHAFAGGVDFTRRLEGGVYELEGWGGGSLVRGSPQAIVALQQSSAHWFQRTDADHVEVDPTAEGMNGWTGGLGFGKIGGAPWLFDVGVEAYSPGFEIRDAGSQRRADRIDSRASLTYQVRDGAGGLRNRAFSLGLTSGWNFGGVRRATALSGAVSVTLGNLWTTWVDGGVNTRALSDDLTRGGPLMETPRSGWLNVGLSSARSESAWWSAQVGSFVDERGGWSTSANAGLTAQVSPRVELSMNVGGSTGDGGLQYLQTLERPDSVFAITDRRYVFGELERTELYAQLRTKIAFAPDAVLTLYGEPFVSSARAHDHSELLAPETDALLVYGEGDTSIERLADRAYQVQVPGEVFRIENFDFWVRSFRSTGVFRWEWAQGSNLFLIWQKTLWSFDDLPGSTGFSTFMGALGDPGLDILVAKVSVMVGSR